MDRTPSYLYALYVRASSTLVNRICMSHANGVSNIGSVDRLSLMRTVWGLFRKKKQSPLLWHQHIQNGHWPLDTVNAKCSAGACSRSTTSIEMASDFLPMDFYRRRKCISQLTANVKKDGWPNERRTLSVVNRFGRKQMTESVCNRWCMIHADVRMWFFRVIASGVLSSCGITCKIKIKREKTVPVATDINRRDPRRVIAVCIDKMSTLRMKTKANVFLYGFHAEACMQNTKYQE